jgi:hypothetical protein
MEATLVYEPSEFEIVETFDFEEEVQRPEELRFFTLDEQLIDYFQKVLPKKKHVEKAEYKKIEKEVDRIRKLHESLIVLTDTDYRIITARRDINVPWLKPIYGGFDYEKYPYAERILPMYQPTARRTPNAYPVLLASLPRPYRSEGTEGVAVVKTTEMVNEEGLEEVKALGNYVKHKRIIHDDGTPEVLDIPVQNTGDDIRRIGFYIEERPLAIPHPLMSHPFLSSNAESKVITNEPLRDVFPTVEAIMSHAVPVTTDPYTEGHKYLKIYDLKLSEIPWKSWSERFPPADTVKSEFHVMSVVFPQSEDLVAPSDRLQKVYESKWSKSIYPRLWLMNQEDGGRLVMKMLLSEAGDFGMIAPDMMHERPNIPLPESTPDDCLKTDNFQEFLASGVYRAPPEVFKRQEWLVTGPAVCAPTAYIVQERQEFINKGRKAWTETAQNNIQKDYIALFKIHQPPKDSTNKPEYEKFKHLETSELHDNVRIILRDDTLLPPDKSYNIRLLIKEITPVNNRFLDVNGTEIICAHALSLLDGDLDADRFGFYTKWTTLEDGFRVCKSCGEQINNDSYVAQEEYDDEGHLILSHDVLADSTFQSDIQPLASSLVQLKNVFQLSNAGEAVMYLLLNQLQVIPNESQLTPVLGNVRKVSLVAKKLQGSEKNRFEGLVGLANTVALLQIHNPSLVPRRSFGNRVIKLSGFPRDTDDDKDSPVLNLLLSSLKELIDAFPTSFQEPMATILREVSKNRKKVRDDCVKFIKQAYTEFKPQFEAAKQRASTVSQTVQANMIVLPDIIPKKYEFNPGEKQGDEEFGDCKATTLRSTITPKLMPSVTQISPDLWKTKPSSNAEYIMPEEVKIRYTFPDKKEIEKGVKIGMSKTLKLELIRKFVESGADGVALSSLLSRLLDILAPLKYPQADIIKFRAFLENVNSFENSSLFRDAVKGRIYELFDSIKSDGMIEAIRTAMYRDLDMNMILLTKEESERQVELLKAKERDTFKQRMRQLTDSEREISKMLLDIGILDYIVTNEDRKLFAKAFGLPTEINDDDIDPSTVPEEGNTNRDYFDDDVQLNENNQPIEPDRGDYGDVRDRPADDYTVQANYDDDIN